jgi:hypothetical protein
VPDNLPPDPWELSYEEVEERLAHVSDDLRPLVREMWLTAPQVQVNTHTLTDMPNAGALFAAVQALTEDEVRKVLHSYLYEYHQLKLTPEEFGRWTVPELQPDDDAAA